jgi:hypothetical protein
MWIMTTNKIDSDDENQEEWETEDQIESDGDGDLGPDEYSDDDL